MERSRRPSRGAGGPDSRARSRLGAGGGGGGDRKGCEVVGGGGEEADHGLTAGDGEVLSTPLLFVHTRTGG